MKKLMFAAAVMAVGAAMAVESQIVGYNAQDLVSSSGAKQNFSMIGIPFNDVTGENLPVSALKITGYAGTDTMYSTPYDEIQVWNNDDGSCLQFLYCTEDGMEGWWDVNFMDTMEGMLADGLPAGQSMWYIADSDGEGREGPLSITISGGVETDPYVDFYLVSSSGAKQNFSQLTNPYPVAWTISEGVCEVKGYAGTDTMYSTPYDEIQVWNNEDGSCAQYLYCNEDGMEGWWDVNFMDVMAEVPAGASFWYIADSDAEEREGDGVLKITFYNPLAD